MVHQAAGGAGGSFVEVGRQRRRVRRPFDCDGRLGGLGHAGREFTDGETRSGREALRLQDDLQAASIVHTLEKAATQRREAEMAHAKALEGYRESARASAA